MRGVKLLNVKRRAGACASALIFASEAIKSGVPNRKQFDKTDIIAYLYNWDELCLIPTSLVNCSWIGVRTTGSHFSWLVNLAAYGFRRGIMS